MTQTQPLMPFVHGLHRYAGSCQCGAVKFEVDLDLGAGTGSCNCRYCTKNGTWTAFTKPAAFELLTDEAALGEKGAGPFDRRRCTTCGVMAFSRGFLKEIGGDFVSVNVRCLDDVDLDGVVIRTLDGAGNTWREIDVRTHRAVQVGGA